MCCVTVSWKVKENCNNHGYRVSPTQYKSKIPQFPSFESLWSVIKTKENVWAKSEQNKYFTDLLGCPSLLTKLCNTTDYLKKTEFSYTEN